MTLSPKNSAPSRRFESYAHRGLALEHPENTLEAFEAALDSGACWIETDVNTTADGVVVIFHDETLERVTGVPGLIAEMTWDQLRQIEFDGGYRIPTLAEAFERFPRAKFNIDIKDDGSAQHLPQVVVDADAIERVRIASFSEERRARTLENLRQLAPQRSLRTSASVRAMYFFMIGSWLPCICYPVMRVLALRFIDRFDSMQVPRTYRLLGIDVPVVTPRMLRAAHWIGVTVQVWTIDEESEMRELIDMGVDGIVTNRVDRLQKVLRSA